MIEVCGLTKAFADAPALAGVTASFPPGTVTGLLGLNGAGKTTLLRVIAGLERPDSGTVTLCGRRLDVHTDPMRLLGVHLDPTTMDPRHTARRHLSWLAALGDIDRRRIDEVLAEVGLADLRHRRIAKLSMGARQRLAIAGALLAEPQVLIFDEPVNGLDVPGIVWLRKLLRRLAGEGCTIVVASHLLGEVALTADRLLVMERGRVAAAGRVDEIVPTDADPREHLEGLLLGMAAA
ncbi:ATP-binding cassette domain-containing protein [Mycolicibacterium sp. 050232]|uniref:ABC transporter ATP-binding protein n=1 Tax=Mycolicibacterium sp. 050232 TaxID=3113982 RepID=UPI002E2E721E|nr:ATP-binding cassette domain-containing protein [Mycolicibacterium sp. 050232]MED5813911.1 ATP-binding cassette domain-containing protein [Mycolicibacterium sp. 050232]